MSLPGIPPKKDLSAEDIDNWKNFNHGTRQNISYFNWVIKY